MQLTINGAFGWLGRELIIGGANVKGVTKIDYTVKQEKTNRYAAGKQPYSRGRKEKQYEGSLGLMYREVLNILASAGVDDLNDVPPFPITIMEKSETGELVTRTLADVEFTEHKVESKQGDDETELECPFIWSGWANLKK